MTRFLVQTRRNGPWALARLEQAIHRRGARPQGGGETLLGAVDAADHVCVLIDVPSEGRAATGEAERIFEQVWYDAFGDRGGGHLTVPLC